MMPQRKESRRVLWRLVTTQGVIRHTPEPRRFKVTIRRNFPEADERTQQCMVQPRLFKNNNFYRMIEVASQTWSLMLSPLKILPIYTHTTLHIICDFYI